MMAAYPEAQPTRRSRRARLRQAPAGFNGSDQGQLNRGDLQAMMHPGYQPAASRSDRRVRREQARAARQPARAARRYEAPADAMQAMAALPGVAAPMTPHRERRHPSQTVALGSPAGGGGSFGGTPLVAEARRWIGGNPTGRSSLWCGNFMNFVLRRTGHSPSSSNMARSFASYGRRVSGPQIGAIAVMSRGRRGGHVGVVSGIDPNGNPIIISGNHGHRVAESVYPRSRIYAYVVP
jgi:uncharacterized protein (TIGR02594 family)